jgi:methylthioribose-1-phosphate isomerase
VARPGLDAAGDVRNTGEACTPIALWLGVHSRVGAHGAFLDLEAEHSAVFQLELAAKERLCVENVAIRRPRRHKQLHLAAADFDVYGLVALSVVVERVGRGAGRLANKRFLHIASLHVDVSPHDLCPVCVYTTWSMRTLEFDERQPALVLVDQTRLPHATELVTCRTPQQVADAITSMQVRGAPAIGVAAAYGVALAALAHTSDDPLAFIQDLDRAAAVLRPTRPTAVNLQWALERMCRTGRDVAQRQGVPSARASLLELANSLADEDVAANRRMGALGLELVPNGANILTHCNAGALATVDYGTAIGVVRAAHEAGRGVHVYVDETRPFLQGARLTAWELQQLGVPMTLITDNMAGHFMSRGKVDLVVVGADRIAANGDVANKIGTYSLAVLARENSIPFYVAAPMSTVDLSLASGADIPIEERAPREVTELGGMRIAPEGITAAHPAFDVTPARLVTAIITERGVLRAPYEASLAAAARWQAPVVA